MTPFREWIVRLWGSVRPRRSDADMQEELRLHLELATEDEQRRTPSSEHARRAAIARVGATTQGIDTLRDQRGLRWLEELGKDLRYGLRTIRRSPLFAAVVVFSLALGTGANSALYSLIDATLLRELSVEAPEELVFFQWRSREWFPDRNQFAGSGSYSGSRFWRSPTFSNAAFGALRAETGTLSDVFAFNRITDVNATVGRQAVSGRMQLVSGNFFEGLRVRPIAGRVITDADDNLSSEPAAVISDRFWERFFHRDPAAIGTAVVLDGVALTIVGVAPREFRSATSGNVPGPDFWLPLAFGPRFNPGSAAQGFWWLSIMGRMRPAVTADQVRGHLEGTFRAAASVTDRPPPGDLPELHVRPGRRGAVDEGPDDELEHAVILGAIFGVLLLIVCLNVANLLLSRSAARRSEISVRLALGASRGRVVRQLLAENLTLAFMGGAMGLVLAYWGKELFGASRLVSPDLDLRIDGALFGITALIATLAGLLFGLVPALRATRIHDGRVVERLELRGGSPSFLNKSLLVAQVASSIVILVVAGLFVRTLGKWNGIDAGFESRNLLVFQVNPASIGYDAEESAVLTDRLLTRIRAVPGVVRLTASGPFWKDQWFGAFFIDGERQRRNHGVPRWLPVRHDFFETLGLPVLAGRAFVPEEDTKAPTVAVVDENLARTYFGSASPVGRRFSFRKDDPEIEIVGVVGNMWMPGTRPEDLMPVIYLPERTRPADFDPEGERRRAAYRVAYETSVEIRTAADPTALLPAIRAAIGEIEPKLTLIDPKTVEQGIRQRLEPTRVASLIWLSFGCVVLVLTAVGLYGILSYSVAQRTREIGIRTALGARRVDIMRLVTGQTSTLVAIGIGVGLAVSMAVNQLVRAFIFGVTFYDVPTLLTVVAILVGVTGLAAFLPARRAARVDPTVALRCE